MNSSVILGAVCFQKFEGDYLEFLDLASSLEFSWVELKFEPPICLREGSKKYGEIKARAERLGIGLSLHTPFVGLNIASLDEDERLLSLKRIQESLNAASEMKIEYATVHGGYLRSEKYSPENWDESVKYNLDSISSLIDFGENIGVTVCLENGNTFKRNFLKHGLHPGELKNIRKQVSDNLKFTVDFGHAMYFSTDPSFLVSELGAGNVKLSHLHNNFQTADTHNPLDSGILKLDRIIDRYMKGNWEFPLSIEMKSVENLKRSVSAFHSNVYLETV